MRDAITPRAVVFDMDGLLLDTEVISKAAFEVTCRDHGIPEIASHYGEIIGRDPIAQNERFRILFPPHIDVELFSDEWRARFMVLLGGQVSLKPGARRVMKSLSARGVKIAVATSTLTSKAETMLNMAELLSFADHLIGGDQVKNGKPAPDIYLKAAMVLGCSPAQCIAFEDSENGVISAHDAGIPVVQVLDLIPASPATRARAIHITKSLDEAMVWLGWWPESVMTNDQ